MLRRCTTTEMLTEGREEQGGHEAMGRGAGPSMKAWHRGGAAVRGWRPVGGWAGLSGRCRHPKTGTQFEGLGATKP